MKQINFHLALYPDTFLWINEQKGIFYNTREHSTFLFDITNLIKNAGITSKNGRNDAKCLNINVVTVTNDAKTEKRKTQRKAEYRKRTVFKSLPEKR